MSVSVVQVATSGSNSASFPANVTAGNTVFVVTYGYAPTGYVIATGTVTLGGSPVAKSTLLQGYQSNDTGPCGGHSIFMLPNCPGGSKTVSWTFTSAASDGLTAQGTIAYEVSGLGTNPLPTMRTAASSTGSTAIDTGGTGQLMFAPEFVLAAAITHAGSASAPGGWTATNNGSNNCWAGYQVATTTGSSYDWTQTGSVSDFWSAGVITVATNSNATGSYRLYNNVNGPATAIAYSGNFLSGVIFSTTVGNSWFEGYWWWVAPTGQSTAPTKCALWQRTGVGGAQPVLVPNSIVTSGNLTAGAWNYIPLPTPLQLTIGSLYTAALSVNGNFPDTNNTWGAGQIYPSGITLGPLNAFGDAGTNVAEYGQFQGVFTTSGSDPSTTCPEGTSTTDSFWVDVQITDQAPANYNGSYRLWPNNGGSQYATSADSAVNYVVGTEIDVTEPISLDKIWYFSPAGTAQLATAATVWSIQTQQIVANNTSPTWSGAAGSGWVSCSFANTTLQPGKYRVTVYNGAASPDGWSAKQLNYWIWSGHGINGIINGPLYAPNTANAQPANLYQASGSEPGQAVFAVGPPNLYPNTYVDNLYQTYWVDMEVQIAQTGLLMASFP